MIRKTEPVIRAHERKIPTFSTERTATTRAGSPPLGTRESNFPLATAQKSIRDIAPVTPPTQIPFRAPKRSAIAPGMNDKRPALKKTAEIVSSWPCVRWSRFFSAPPYNPKA